MILEVERKIASMTLEFMAVRAHLDLMRIMAMDRVIGCHRERRGVIVVPRTVLQAIRMADKCYVSVPKRNGWGVFQDFQKRSPV